MEEQEIVRFGDKWAKIETIDEENGISEVRLMEMVDEELTPTDKIETVKVEELTTINDRMSELENEINDTIDDASDEELDALEKELLEEDEEEEEEEVIIDESKEADEEEELDAEEELKKKVKSVKSALTLVKKIFQKKELSSNSYAAYMGYSNIRFVLVREVIGTIAVCSSMYYNKEDDAWIAEEWIDMVLASNLTPITALPSPNDVDDFISDEAKAEDVDIAQDETDEVEDVKKKRLKSAQK